MGYKFLSLVARSQYGSAVVVVSGKLTPRGGGQILNSVGHRDHYEAHQLVRLDEILRHSTGKSITNPSSASWVLDTVICHIIFAYISL